MLLYIGLQYPGRLSRALRHIHNHITRHRAAIEQVSIHGIGDVSQQRVSGTALDALAYSLGAYGVLRVGDLDGGPVHVAADVHDGGGFVLPQADVGGQAVLGVVDVAFEAGQAEAHDGGALDLGGEALGMEDGAAVGDAQVVEDVVAAGVAVELDHDEAGCQGGDGAGALEGVAGDADQAGTGDAGDGG